MKYLTSAKYNCNRCKLYSEQYYKFSKYEVCYLCLQDLKKHIKTLEYKLESQYHVLLHIG